MVNEKLTTTIYHCTLRSLETKDRFLYSLILAFLVTITQSKYLHYITTSPRITFPFQIEESYGRLHVGDREYIIHPSFGQATMQALRNQFPTPENKPSFVSPKKPFDWMKDGACSQLVVSVSFHELHRVFNIESCCFPDSGDSLRLVHRRVREDAAGWERDPVENSL